MHDSPAFAVDESLLAPSRQAILVCVDSSESSEQAVKAAQRIAMAEQVRWHVVHVQTPQLQALSRSVRMTAFKAIHLGACLGAKTEVLYATHAAQALVRYARDHALTRVLVGKAQGSARRASAEHWGARIAELAPDFRVQVVDCASDAGDRLSDVKPAATRRGMAGLLASTIAVSVAFVLSTLQFRLQIDDASIAMVMVLSVALVAVLGGRRAAAITTFFNLLCYLYYVIPPRNSFAIDDGPSLVSFLVMLCVGLMMGEMTARVRQQAKASALRERRAYALAAFSRNLSLQLSVEQVLRAGAQTVAQTFACQVQMFSATPDGAWQCMTDSDSSASADARLMTRAVREGRAVGLGTAIESHSAWLVVPLNSAARNEGVMTICKDPVDAAMPADQVHEIEVFGSVIALALERVHYAQVARDALLGVEAERLRNSLLAALSHDLQTPLASVVGLADAVLLTRPTLSAQQREIVLAIIDEGQRMSASVGNLLQMAKLESGPVRLRCDWHSIEEVVGSALAATRRRLAPRRIVVRLAPDLPLVEFDAALIERVLINLLDNAAKHTSAQSEVVIEADRTEHALRVAVADDGPGLPFGQEEAVFAKFARGKSEATGSGVGLGLAICRAIMTAHNGSIHADRSAMRGARFVLSLPLFEAPAVAHEVQEVKHA